MFGNKSAVLEMPADAIASADGGALEYAGFWLRVAAVIVDTAIVMIVGIALIIVLGMAMGGAGVMIGNIIYVFFSLLYWPVMESSSRQATFGKSLMGIQVTDLDGNRVSFVRALLRYLAKIISSIPLGIGFLLAAFTARKQALHDIITSCLVVRAGPSSFLKAMVAAVVGLVLAIGASYYYFAKVYMPQQMDQAMKGAGGDFQREMEKAMKGAGKDMAREIERAMKEAQKAQPPVTAAPSTPPASFAVPKPADTPPAARPAQQAAVAPGAQPAPRSAPTVPEKPAVVALAPARPAAKAATADGDKPRARRRAAPRKPAAAPSGTAMTPAAAPKAPKYNDVMTAVMGRDRAGAAEALDAGFWVDRRDSNGVTPLMAAAMNGDAAMVQLLLKHGANPNLSGPGGSVLSYANRSGDGNLAGLLRKAGAR